MEPGDRARPRWRLFAGRGSLAFYSILAWNFALIPSVLLVLAANALFAHAGADVSALQKPATDITQRNPLIAVVVAPLVETALLAAVIELLRRLTANVWIVAVVTGLAWGAAHAVFHPLWFFGTAWSFFVFARGYLAWRPVSYKHAFGAAALPHALVNASALLMQFIARS